MTASYDGVAKLGFGAMRLPLTDPDDVTAIDIEQLKAMVDEFIAKGAPMWTPPSSTTTAPLRRLCARRSWNATRATPIPWPRSAWPGPAPARRRPRRACPPPLSGWGVDYIDYYLLHNLGGARTAKFDEYDMWNYVAKAKADGSCVTSASPCTTAPMRWTRC